MENEHKSIAESGTSDSKSGKKLNDVNNRNLKLKILLGLIFFLIIILLIALIFDSTQPLSPVKNNQFNVEQWRLITGKPGPSVTLVLTPTSTINRTNWKTYESKAGFFTFKYPPQFIVHEEYERFSINDKETLNYNIAFGNVSIKKLQADSIPNTYLMQFIISITKTATAKLVDYLHSIYPNAAFIEDLPLQYGADEAMKITNPTDDNRVEYYYRFDNEIISLRMEDIANSKLPTPMPDYSELLNASRIYETFEFDKNKIPKL